MHLLQPVLKFFMREGAVVPGIKGGGGLMQGGKPMLAYGLSSFQVGVCGDFSKGDKCLPLYPPKGTPVYIRTSQCST